LTALGGGDVVVPADTARTIWLLEPPPLESESPSEGVQLFSGVCEEMAPAGGGKPPRAYEVMVISHQIIDIYHCGPSRVVALTTKAEKGAAIPLTGIDEFMTPAFRCFPSPVSNAGSELPVSILLKLANCVSEDRPLDVTARLNANPEHDLLLSGVRRSRMAL
jgi:hypothetical protein